MMIHEIEENKDNERFKNYFKEKRHHIWKLSNEICNLLGKFSFVEVFLDVISYHSVY